MSYAAASLPLQADVGQTYNSSLTAQYITRYDTMLAGSGGVDLILNVGDLTVRLGLPRRLLSACRSVDVAVPALPRVGGMCSFWQPLPAARTPRASRLSPAR